MNRRRTLDNFIVGASNRLAHAAASAMSRRPPPVDAQTLWEVWAGGTLFLYGACGMGKTHLLEAVCAGAIARGGRAHHVAAGDYAAPEVCPPEEVLGELDVLAIDDVQLLRGSAQPELVRVLDMIRARGGTAVFASDVHPQRLCGVIADLRSRMLGGFVVEMERPDAATRELIVARLSAERGLPLSAAGARTIASRCVGSVREIEGVLAKLVLLRDLASPGTPGTRGTGDAGVGGVSLRMVHEALREGEEAAAAPVRLTTIIDSVCRRLNVCAADLAGTTRDRRVVMARGLYAWASRELTTHSYPEIAGAIGRRWHSIVFTAEERVRGQMDEDATFEPGASSSPVRVRDLADEIAYDARCRARRHQRCEEAAP